MIETWSAGLLLPQAGDALMLAGVLVVAGLATGFLSGLLGIGGGAIMAPVLYDVFGALGVDPALRMHLAVGTALAVMVPTTIRSYLAHKSRGAVERSALVRLAPGVVLGVLFGAIVARHAPGALLKGLWVAFATTMSLKLLFGEVGWQLGEELPRRPLTELFATLIGVLSMLLSIGGAAFVTTLLTLYGRTIHTAVGTASGIGVLIAVPGALGFMWAGFAKDGLPPLSIGYVSLLGALILVPSSVFAAPFGVRVAHGLSRRALEVAFGLLLMSVGLRFLVSLLP